MTPPVPQSIEDYVRMLEDGTHFAQVNFGDGEWGIVTGTLTGNNCDGKPSTHLTGQLLRKIILKPRLTFVGYNPGKEGSVTRTATEAWLTEHNVNVPVLGHHKLEDPDYGRKAINVRWTHKEIVPSGNLRGRFGPVFKALRGRFPVLIGPDYHNHEFLERVVGVRKKGLIPQSFNLDDCWMDVLNWTRSALDGSPKDAVLLLALGYIGKPVAWYVADSHPGVTIFDLGACLDPYSGSLSRSGYARPEFQEMLAKNLAEAGRLGGGLDEGGLDPAA